VRDIQGRTITLGCFPRHRFWRSRRWHAGGVNRPDPDWRWWEEWPAYYLFFTGPNRVD
jgi:hypothetical protein